MQVKELEITARSQYADFQEPFKGKVTIQGSTGNQEIFLTAQSISAIFAVVREQVALTAKHNAKQVNTAIQSAVDSPLLLEQASVGALE